MAASPNLKITYTADTSGLAKGTREAKAAVKDFSKVSEGALSSVGNALGVNTGQVEQLTSAIRGLGIRMTQSGNEGAAAFGKLLSGISSTTAAIAGLGIGAAVAAFKSLNAQAENFKQTVAGANIELMTSAYVSTYQQVFYDLNAAQGKSFAEFKARLKEIAGSAKSIFGSLVTSGMKDSSTALLGIASPKFWKDTTDTMKEANQKGNEAKRIANDIYQLELKRSQSQREWAQLESEAAALKNQSLDKSKSQAERAEALRKAEQLIRQIYEERLSIETQIADNMDRMNSLASSTPQAIEAANAQRTKANGLQAEMEQKLSRILSKQQSLNTATKEYTKELMLSAEQMARLAADERFELVDLPAGPGITGKATTDAGITVPIKPVIPEKSITDISAQVESVVSSVADSMSDSIGQLIGDLTTGGDAWQNFAYNALSTFGDLAMQIGKMAVGVGVATLGIKAALESLNPYAAIAAGAALIALGAAVKVGMANLASSSAGYSASTASTSVAAAGYSSGGKQDFEGREFTMHVDGEFKLNGNTLVAAIDKEKRRTAHTT